MSRLHFIITMIVVFAPGCYAGVLVVEDGLEIHSMSEGVEAGGDCGCYFYQAGKPEQSSFLLYWPWSEGSAVMKINGKLEQMEISKDDSSNSSNYKKEISFAHRNKNISVTGKCKATWVCPEDSESCEITKYSGKISVKQDKKTISTAVKGVCGC